MIKLYLDDIRNLPDDSWTLCRDVPAAQALLVNGDVEYASLDHDMGECEECANSFPTRGYPLVSDTCRHKKTGYDLVVWMAETGHWSKHKPMVHSANPVGRAAMIQAIEKHFPTEG